MEKKYVLTNEEKTIDGIVLHRILAIINLGDVKIGDLGGWVEKESNLSHHGACWVYDESCVFGDARASGQANVLDKASAFDITHVYGDTKLTREPKKEQNPKLDIKIEINGKSLSVDELKELIKNL